MDKVLDYFKKKGDTDQYQAALFLIANIDGHYSSKNIWLDKSGKEVFFNTTKFADIEEAIKGFQKLKDSIVLTPKEIIIKDRDIIESSFLIKNIELAYQSWKQNPWSSSYDFKTFCEYILPYRSLTEPLEDWRSEYQFAYQKSATNLSDKNDPVELCSQIIKDIKHFDFVTSRFDPKQLLGPSELLFWRQGNCPDLANVALFACRSLGVAVTFDFTPHYAASSNRHFWNTVIDNKGVHVPFNGNQDLPYIYSPNHRRMGKVFRSTFSNQQQSLAAILPANQIPEPFLRSKNILDVTSEYVPVSDLNYVFDNISSKIAYINVFNRGSWNTIDWAKVVDKKTTFTNMGRNIVYLPGIYDGSKMIFEKYPILIDTKGKQTILKPDYGVLYTANLSRSNEIKNEFKDNNPLQIIKGEKYTLFIWNNGNWQVIDQQIASADDLVSFLKIPKNGLFLMASSKPDFFERIFTVDTFTSQITWY
ncbi:transglutaminase-like domain-containing protein [Flavobacterium limi]|uniref:Transglutaminase-like domain-containing protein n=1 Tax=Flavobacterium limi TaxID=2045105 RepID=A0ABQ1THM5_9FLAO|nr:transglutaminase-like domain-containing protein [Flavobacterium limi]GGE94817.1 hypothetical protein GCM10011518_00150 [Flavobacterium limi]